MECFPLHFRRLLLPPGGGGSRANPWRYRGGGPLATNPPSCLLTIAFLSPQFHFNPAQSILVMEGEDLENMNAAVRKVSYINSRQFPTPGARRLRISTSVQ